MLYLVDPRSIKADPKCILYCKKLVACPLDWAYPLYGIDI